MLKFGFKHFTEDTPRRVEKILRAFRRVMAVAMGASYLADKEGLMFILLIISSIIDETANLIGEDIKANPATKTTIITPHSDPTSQTITQETIDPEG